MPHVQVDLPVLLDKAAREGGVVDQIFCSGKHPVIGDASEFHQLVHLQSVMLQLFLYGSFVVAAAGKYNGIFPVFFLI